MSTYACEHCNDTGSLSKDIEGMPDCAHCSVAQQRVELENWAIKEKLACSVSALWLIYSKGRSDERKTSGGSK